MRHLPLQAHNTKRTGFRTAAWRPSGDFHKNAHLREAFLQGTGMSPACSVAMKETLTVLLRKPRGPQSRPASLRTLQAITSQLLGPAILGRNQASESAPAAGVPSVREPACRSQNLNLTPALKAGLNSSPETSTNSLHSSSAIDNNRVRDSNTTLQRFSTDFVSCVVLVPGLECGPILGTFPAEGHRNGPTCWVQFRGPVVDPFAHTV